jgi:hypothetical protein
MYPHRIRLRGPWTVEPAGPGRVVCRRRFGLPRRLDAGERVFLTGDGSSGRVAVTLNGSPLGDADGAAWEFEVGVWLRERNELAVEADARDDGAVPWGEVALEIRALAWLRGVRVEGGDVVGEVAGEAERPLDLYVLGGGSTLAHAAVVAGQAFRVGAAAGAERVELVDGGVVWDGRGLTPPAPSPACGSTAPRRSAPG